MRQVTTTTLVFEAVIRGTSGSTNAPSSSLQVVTSSSSAGRLSLGRW
jgi:hypothetical protein